VANAKVKGGKFGRKLILSPQQQREAMKRRGIGEETLSDSARSYSVNSSTISRLTAEMQPPG
jgi:uncharacterized protein